MANLLQAAGISLSSRSFSGPAATGAAAAGGQCNLALPKDTAPEAAKLELFSTPESSRETVKQARQPIPGKCFAPTLLFGASPTPSGLHAAAAGRECWLPGGGSW